VKGRGGGLDDGSDADATSAGLGVSSGYRAANIYHLLRPRPLVSIIPVAEIIDLPISPSIIHDHIDLAIEVTGAGGDDMAAVLRSTASSINEASHGNP